VKKKSFHLLEGTMNTFLTEKSKIKETAQYFEKTVFLQTGFRFL
jgi:hypothetical protein